MVDKRDTSVKIRKARTNSRAVEESRPLVELTMQTISTTGQSELRIHLLVPRRYLGTKGESLADGNTLLLPAGHTPDGSITDWCVLNMAQTEDGLGNISYSGHVGTACMILEARMWCAHLGCKLQRLVDCECWEMNVILGAVNDVAAVVLGNILCGERVIVYLALHKMIFGTLIGKRLQQRAAPRARTSQDNCGQVRTSLARK